MIMRDDTICALSTPNAPGAIGVIRLSGDKAIAIANSVFEGKDLSKQKGQSLHFGKIKKGDEIIDEVDLVRDHRISYEEFLSLWDEDDDELLRRNLKDVERRRTRRNSILGPPENQVSFDSLDTSSYSNDSATESGPAHQYFAKEKEKSLRGVWV